MRNRFWGGRLGALFLVILTLAVFLQGRPVCGAPAVAADDGGDGPVAGDLAAAREDPEASRRERRESPGRGRRLFRLPAAGTGRKPAGESAGKRYPPACVLRC
ncbi:MAG: hypothetical protein KBC20_04110 [Oscillospiraceae bacterium]|nr:hypothetical protein [Oscillospiraceae bacterium]